MRSRAHRSASCRGPTKGLGTVPKPKAETTPPSTPFMGSAAHRSSLPHEEVAQRGQAQGLNPNPQDPDTPLECSRAHLPIFHPLHGQRSSPFVPVQGLHKGVRHSA